MSPDEKAAAGVALLEEAILDRLREQPDGFYNNELARDLKIESSYGGKHSNYLSYSLLGGLMGKGLVTTEKRDGRLFYKVVAP